MGEKQVKEKPLASDPGERMKQSDPLFQLRADRRKQGQGPVRRHRDDQWQLQWCGPGQPWMRESKGCVHAARCSTALFW